MNHDAGGVDHRPQRAARVRRRNAASAQRLNRLGAASLSGGRRLRAICARSSAGAPPAGRGSRRVAAVPRFSMLAHAGPLPQYLDARDDPGIGHAVEIICVFGLRSWSLSNEANASSRRTLLALRREAGRADRRGARGARSRSARQRCSGRATCRFRSRWSSRRSTGANYERALEKARASAEYHRDRARARTAAIARGFSPATRCGCSDLFELVGPVPGIEVLIDDRPVPYLARAVAAAAVVSPAGLIDAWRRQKSDFDQQMKHLEAEIRRLEAEFNMFFAGRLPRPPWETRAKVAALVKKHDQSFIHNTADRFRFESLQNRHAKFIELWERQMTNRELGRPMSGATEARRRRRHAGGRLPATPPDTRRPAAAARARRPLNASSSSAAPTTRARDRRA